MFHEALKAPGTENTKMVSIATTVIRCPRKAGSYSRKSSNYNPSGLFHLNDGSAAKIFMEQVSESKYFSFQMFKTFLTD